MTALTTYSKAGNELDRATGQTMGIYSIAIDEAMTGRVSRAPSPIPEAKN